MLSVHFCAFGQATDSIVSSTKACPSTAQAPVVQQVTIVQSQAENNDVKKRPNATSVKHLNSQPFSHTSISDSSHRMRLSSSIVHRA